MNTNSPLVPQGTTPPRGKSSLYFKVLMILTVHVVLIGGLLLQGCKDTAKEQPKETTAANPPDAGYAAATNSNPDTVPPVNMNTLSNNQVAAAQPSSQPATPPPAAPPLAAPPIQSPPTMTPVVPMGSSVDYVIAAGDTFGAIARRQHVSVTALMNANPGVVPKKLRVGEKIQIPAGTTAVAAASATAPASEAMGAEGSVYVVKSGDTLGKIARLHGTSFKKLMALNDLKTTSIRAGQKLKMPAPKPAGAEVAPASASTAQPQAGAVPIPAGTTGAAN